MQKKIRQKIPLLTRLEQKFGNFCVPNLMTLIVVGMAVVFLADNLISPEQTFRLSQVISFDRDAVFRGEVWRLITFVFLPPSSNPLFMVFALYLNWLIGDPLERHWGTFRFKVYYLTGILGSIIGGMLTGYATNLYLNETLFIAFALLYSDFQLNLFFVLPLRAVWLAWIDALLFVIEFIMSPWLYRVAMLFSVINFFLFFGKQLWFRIQQFFRRRKLKKMRKAENSQNWKNHWWNDKHNDPFHR